MSAWLRLASLWMTLMRSYTTRRSQPMIRSRLRRPTSKSITAVLWPRMARPEAKLALEVVLPTPPLPDVTTMIFAKRYSLLIKRWFRLFDIERQHFDLVAVQANLGRRARRHIAEAILEGAIHACNRHQFGFHAHGEN